MTSISRPSLRETAIFFSSGTIISKIRKELAFHVSFVIFWISIDYMLKHDTRFDFYNLPAIEIALQQVAILSIAISFIIQFRNNNAYQRFHEGREIWGGIVNDTRNFADLIQTNVRYVENSHYNENELKEFKAKLIYNVITLVFLIKDHLRDEINETLDELPYFQYLDLNVISLEHKPNAVLMMLHKHLAELQELRLVNDLNHYMLSTVIARLTDRLGGCERIKATPVPRVYTILTYRLIHVYLIWLSLGLIASNYLAALIVIPLAAYIFFGFAEIGTEIMNPFADSNFTFDLLGITHMIDRNLSELVRMPLELPPIDDKPPVVKEFQ